MPVKATIEIDARQKTFASGLLPDLLAALRDCRVGDLVAVNGEAAIGSDLETWCRFTRNTLLETESTSGRSRWVFRFGESAEKPEPLRPVGARLWLYTNFDCNLSCDYCCVRSSPKAPRRALGLERIQRITREATALGVQEIFVTGGEPFLLNEIGEILHACLAVAPTTVLTNGMLFAGPRLTVLRSLPRDRLTFQISLDSPTPERHDRHRGAGSWMRAWRGIQRVRAEGFRVRLAATVADDTQGEEFRDFLDAENIAPDDRVIRRIALRGAAEDGLALARADLVPEVTITADGVFWHPVGAEDADLLVSREIFPLADSFAAVRGAFERETAHQRSLAKIFNCA